MVRFGTWVAVALASGMGCGDDVDTTPDAGDGGTVDAGLQVTPPDIPWLDDGVPPIGLTPCPDGWREMDVRGVAECHPYPEGGPASCTPGEAHFPGEPGCRPIGQNCPEGDYATTLPSGDRIVYVNPGASAGGDGSMGSPHARLSDVNWLSVSTGTTVALAKGTYEGTLALRGGARVIGACAAETTITGTDAPIQAAITVTNVGAPAIVENLTLADTPQWGILVNEGRSMELRGVRVTGVRRLGVVAVDAGSSVRLRDVVIDGTLPESGTTAFGGLYAQDGAQIDAEHLIISGNDGAGVFCSGVGTSVTVTDAFVSGGDASLADRGLIAQGGAQLSATRLLVSAARDVGIFFGQADTAVTLTDTIVQNTRPVARGSRGGRGIDGRAGGVLDASRVVVTESRLVGIGLSEMGSAATLRDVVVRDTRAQESDGGGGRGMNVQLGAVLDAERLLVSGNLEEGIFATDAETTLTIREAVVRDTESRESDGHFGRGIDITQGAALTATRMLVARSHAQGVLALGGGASVTLADVVIRDSSPRESDGTRGNGLAVQYDARISGERILVDGAHEQGVLAINGGVVDLRDATLTGIERSACTATTCADDTFGYGAAAVSATVRLERFQILDAATCGVFVSPVATFGGTSPFETDPAMDLLSGSVSDSEVGACVQVDSYDLDRLQRDVSYRNNGTNLSSTMLPVPAVLTAADPG